MLSILRVLQNTKKLGMAVPTFSSSTQEKEAGRSQWVPGHPDLHSKPQASQCYSMNPALKQQNTKGKGSH